MFRFVALIVSPLLLLNAGCSSIGQGTPTGQAQVVVTGVIEPQIETKAEEVFYRYGFEFKGAGEGHLEFERAGGVMGNILYGNWQEDDVTTRVTLYIIKKAPMTYALRTRSMAVRHTFGADSDTELFDIQGTRFSAILKKIAKELQEEHSAPGTR